MKGKITLVLTSLFMALLGIVMISFYDNPNMAELIAISLGVLFLAPSLFSIIMLLFTNVPVDDSMHNPRYNLIPTIGGLSFGLIIILKAEVFVGVLKYLFAMLLILGGLYYVFYLAFSKNRVSMPKWFFFLPTMVTLAGAVALLLPIESNPVMFMTVGVSLVALALTQVLIAFTEYALSRAEAKKNASVVDVAEPEVMEVEPTDAEETRL